MVVLGIDGRPALSDHEAHALALLLSETGGAAELDLARMLGRARIPQRRLVNLRKAEKQALLAALGELRSDRAPERLLAIERTLERELAH